jgi:hypothetical protein
VTGSNDNLYTQQICEYNMRKNVTGNQSTTYGAGFITVIATFVGTATDPGRLHTYQILEYDMNNNNTGNQSSTYDFHTGTATA